MLESKPIQFMPPRASRRWSRSAGGMRRHFGGGAGWSSAASLGWVAAAVSQDLDPSPDISGQTLRAAALRLVAHPVHVYIYQYIYTCIEILLVQYYMKI